MNRAAEAAAGQLAYHHRLLLAILSLSSQPLRRTPLARMLKHLNVRIPRAGSGKQPDVAPSSTNILPILEELASTYQLASPNDEWLIPPKVAHHVLSQLGTNEPDTVAQAEQALLMEYNSGYEDKDIVIVFARTALYLGHEEKLTEAMDDITKLSDRLSSPKKKLTTTAIFPSEYANLYLNLLPSKLLAKYLKDAFEEALSNGFALPSSLIPTVQSLTGPFARPAMYAACILYDLLEVEVDWSQSLEQERDGAWQERLALRAFMDGRTEEGFDHIQRAWVASAVYPKRRKPRLETWIAPLLTVLASKGPPTLKALVASQAKGPESRRHGRSIYATAEWLLLNAPHIWSFPAPERDWLSTLSTNLALIWGFPKDTKFLCYDISTRMAHKSENLAETLQNQGLNWAAAQMSMAARELREKPPEKGPYISLSTLRVEQAEWMLKLDALEAELVETSPTAPLSDERLIWRVRIIKGRLALEPRIQKSKASGGWTGGRSVAANRLAKLPHLPEPWATEDDIRVARTLRRYSDYYGRDYYEYSARMPLMLVGHPRVFLEDNDETPITVVQEAPSVVVERDESNHFIVKLVPSFPSDEIYCEVTGPTQLTVYAQTTEQQRVSERIGDGFTVPVHAESRLKSVLEPLAARFSILSDLGIGEDAAQLYDTDSTLYFELERYGDGIRVRASIYPLGFEGPRFAPGEGNTNILGRVEGTLYRGLRDLEQERTHFEQMMAQCHQLATLLHTDAFESPDLTQSLEVLQELQSLGDGVQLRWKQGEPISVTAEQSDANLRMMIQSEASDWFAASGSLQVNESLVLGLKELLDLLPARHQRYIPLDESRFLALSDSLLAKLNTLAAMDSADKNSDHIQLHPVVAGVVTGWASELNQLSIDTQAEQRLKRVKEAAELRPRLPKALKADLRPYQVEGFTWMARLAHWGAGACLADDMGLGKTIQSITMLLYRAKRGPALVVAPTSVCGGWMEQGLQFAPSLRWHAWEGSRDYETEWGTSDVVVISYTMLTQHIEQLAGYEFATLVLDEAQAIKNAKAQRSQAARQLTAEFRLATTGTPIENHLGELWSLMEFLNPGLLGTPKTFERRFVRETNQAESNMGWAPLRNVLKPFVLRRKKDEVLKELPPRTEVVVPIEPSEDEVAFSEALRRRALERLHKEGDDLKKSAMTMLAELTRLRQAACHPALVDNTLGIGSAKLEYLKELVTNLIDEGHRILIFSQFVSFLQLVKTAFDKQGVTYKYLDGSTPKKQREVSIREFQSGEGDTFLISLKAGGTGLNLTGADYVIHLDPWWNPAVEDQASSRAHRMGQTRPVTVYRLVTKGSVEERVYALHGEKRDLAENILMDTGTAQTPDVETLLQLLQPE